MFENRVFPCCFQNRIYKSLCVFRSFDYKFMHLRRNKSQNTGNRNYQNYIKPIPDQTQADKHVCNDHVVNENAVRNVGLDGDFRETVRKPDCSDAKR